MRCNSASRAACSAPEADRFRSNSSLINALGFRGCRCGACTCAMARPWLLVSASRLGFSGCLSVSFPSSLQAEGQGFDTLGGHRKALVQGVSVIANLGKLAHGHAAGHEQTGMATVSGKSLESMCESRDKGPQFNAPVKPLHNSRLWIAEAGRLKLDTNVLRLGEEAHGVVSTFSPDP